MNRSSILAILLSLPLMASAGIPDSVYVRPYALDGGDGLRLEWSTSQQQWSQVYDGTLLGSDYGAWGRDKKLYAPSITKGRDGSYVIVFQLRANGNVNQFGVTTTRDFIHYRPQDYPYMVGLKEVKNPIVTCSQGVYRVTFESEGKTYVTTSSDLVHFTLPQPTDTPNATLPTRVPYVTIEGIRAAKQISFKRSELYNESAADDARRFEGLQSVTADIAVDASAAKPISDKLMGIFFEDINYSADGGLYAELIQNRDFEYSARDRREWHALTAWSLKGDGATLSIETHNPIHVNNPHYAVLDVKSPSDAKLVNEGYDGITLRKGEKYDVSAFLRQIEGKSGKVNVFLEEDGKVVGKATISVHGKEWKQKKAVITATSDCHHAVLSLQPTTVGKLAVDFVSLFPQNTFHGHKNGLRRDLAETLEALHPKFMRFPGGCVAHGNGLDNIYRWKETIGPLWERKSQPNLWGYHQSRGLGYYEYFQFCEDLKMEPLPVLAAGVPCQNSSVGGNGQQGGIPMADMPAYIQDILDLIEWANGDAKSTEWGRKRAEQGHPKPFNLHYIGIGNEDLVSPTFEERYLMIIKAIKEKYPDIIVCGTVGPFFEGSDYERGWQVAADNHIDMVDEHYYVAPAWYMYNQNFYDQYDRTSSKVYLGEWAAHGRGRVSTIETALACALHYCSLERNGDIVKMSSYAPLLAKHGHTQWNPDLIYFNNEGVFPTVDYWAQQLHGAYAGDIYLPSTICANEQRHGVNERLAVSTVKDSHTGRTCLKVVNMLPMQVNARLHLGEELMPNGTKSFKAHILTGAYDSKEAKVADIEVKITDNMLTIPPYSFIVIEMN